MDRRPKDKRNRRRGRRNGGAGNGSKPRDQRGPREQREPREPREPQQPHIPKRYAVVFYDTFAAARSAVEELNAKKAEVDQLNIVIRAEGNMDDPELAPYGKVFAGTAWTQIHERRVTEGWYETAH